MTKALKKERVQWAIDDEGHVEFFDILDTYCVPEIRTCLLCCCNIGWSDTTAHRIMTLELEI